MENEQYTYTPQAEIDATIAQLKEANEWPGGDNQVVTRGIMMQRRLALMVMGTKLPPITL